MRRGSKGRSVHAYPTWQNICQQLSPSLLSLSVHGKLPFPFQQLQTSNKHWDHDQVQDLNVFHSNISEEEATVCLTMTIDQRNIMIRACTLEELVSYLCFMWNKCLPPCTDKSIHVQFPSQGFVFQLFTEFTRFLPEHKPKTGFLFLSLPNMERLLPLGQTSQSPMNFSFCIFSIAALYYPSSNPDVSRGRCVRGRWRSYRLLSVGGV